MKTISDILGTMKKWAQNNEIHSPAEYLQLAFELNAMQGDLGDQIIETDIALAKLVEEFQEEGMTSARAMNKAKTYEKEGVSLYKNLKRLEARKDIVMEHIRIARKAADTGHWAGG